MSQINVLSLITVQGDTLSKKNKHAGRKSSSISVQVSFFTENTFTLTLDLLLFLYYFLLTGMSPIKKSGTDLASVDENSAVRATRTIRVP